MTTSLLLFYFPSLVGLVLLFIYFLQMLREAMKVRSLITPLVSSLVLVGIGLIVSWCIVLYHAIEMLGHNTPLFSWQVLLLPVFWAILLVPINIMIRRHD